jgi:hypothetical protein
VRETGIQYTFASDAGSFTINPTGWNGAGYYARKVTVQPSIRASVSDRPQQDGSYADESFLGGLVLDLDCLILGTSATSRQSLNTTAIKVLRGAKNGSGLLTWTAQDGSEAQRLYGLTLTGYPQVEYVGGTAKAFLAQLQAERPYAESATATEVDSVALTSAGAGFVIPLTMPFTMTSSGGGTLTYANNGSAPIRPVLRVYGPATNPVVTNVTSGERLSFTGSIASGEFWEIDLFQRTVTLNGVATATSPLRSITPSASTWFECDLGNTTLQLTCSAFDSNTKLRAYQRSAWG